MQESIAAQPQNTLSLLSENWFCKPKVGGSIPSSGTIKTASILGFSRFSMPGKHGKSGEQMRFYQPQKQDHLFLMCPVSPSQGEAA